MRGKHEFDQPHKQTESKIQVTGKISNNKKDLACVTVGMLRQVILCTQKKQRRPTWDPPLAN